MNRTEALQLLQTEISQCSKCPMLCEHRTQVVFGAGNSSSRLFLIGEAPGQQEDKEGKPFVGKSGQLLTNILLSFNIKREQIYISNTCKCRPPGNRTPTDDEVSNCKPYLWLELKLIKPQIIVCLGATAAKGMLNTEEGIGRLRGKVHDISHPVESKVVCTYHPSYLLRNPSAKKYVEEDFKTIHDYLLQKH